MLSLGHTLISDLAIANLSINSLLLLYLATLFYIEDTFTWDIITFVSSCICIATGPEALTHISYSGRSWSEGTKFSVLSSTDRYTWKICPAAPYKQVKCYAVALYTIGWSRCDVMWCVRVCVCVCVFVHVVGWVGECVGGCMNECNDFEDKEMHFHHNELSPFI